MCLLVTVEARRLVRVLLCWQLALPGLGILVVPDRGPPVLRRNLSSRGYFCLSLPSAVCGELEMAEPKGLMVDSWCVGEL